VLNHLVMQQQSCPAPAASNYMLLGQSANDSTTERARAGFPDDFTGLGAYVPGRLSIAMSERRASRETMRRPRC
jgi:hypothetical protein